MTATQQGWKRRERPPRLERRLAFDEYEQTRDFLDAVAVICEPGGYYPDISFGRTYANITIHAEQDAADFSAAARDGAEAAHDVEAEAIDDVEVDVGGEGFAGRLPEKGRGAGGAGIRLGGSGSVRIHGDTGGQ